MSPTENTALVGAIAGRVAVFAIGPVALAIAQHMSNHQPFEFSITSIGIDDNVGERVAAGLLLHSGSAVSAPGSAVSAPGSVLLIGDTAQAELTTATVQALARDGGPNTRLRIWPVFVSGDPSELDEFDATLDELPDANCDAVLMLTHVPGPEQAARALLAWLTVKLPAPASVLGQMPDAAGRICRYVALGSELVAALRDTDEGAKTGAAENSDSAVSGGLAAAIGVATQRPDPLEVSELLGRLQTALNEQPGMVALRDSRAMINTAMDAANLTAVVEAHQQLVMAGDADIRMELDALTTELVVAAGRESGRATETADTPAPSALDDHLGLATSGTADTGGTRAAAPSQAGPPSKPSLATALAQYLVVAGKTGLGRMVSGGRRRQAAVDLAAAADAFVAGVEQAWIAQGEQLLHAAVLAGAERARAAAVAGAAAESAARATAAEARWKTQVEGAMATGNTWQGVDESRVVRSWGSGAAAARRYVIGSGELLETVVDLTDGSEPCLRVITATATEAVTVLTAQYGLPLSALS